MVALIAIVLASFLWSTAGVGKILVRVFDPFTATFVRFLIASLVIFPLVLKEKHKTNTWIRDLVPVATLSTVNVLFFYIGLTTSTANAATIIYTASPLLVAVLARLLIKEPLSAAKLAGILVGLVGTLLVALLPMIEKNHMVSGEFGGNLFFLGAVVAWSLYAIASRRVLRTGRYSPILLSATSIFTTTALLLPFSVVHVQPQYVSRVLDPYYLSLFLYVGIFLTVATYMLYQWAIKHSSATTASLHVYLQTVFAVAFNIVVLDEQLTVGFLIGSVLVIAGVFLATGARLYEEVRTMVSKAMSS